MITRVLIIIICFVLIAPTKSAGTKKQIDCKKIDQLKFKELFNFKYGGGPTGLYIDVPKDKFKVENCDFFVKETKSVVAGRKNFIRQPGKIKLNGLTACTKYDVMMTIQNVATKKDFTYQNSVFTKIDSKFSKLELKVGKVENNSVSLSWNHLSETCISKYKLTVMNSKNESVFVDENAKDGALIVSSLPLCDIYTAQVVMMTVNNEKVSSPSKTFLTKSENILDNLELLVDDVQSDSVSLSWTSNNDCPQEFKINVRNSEDEVVYTKTVYANSIVITNLTSCSNYSVELIALDDNKLAVKAVIKTFLTKSLPVENLKIKVDGMKAKVTWTSPQRLECVDSFTLSYVIEDCNFKFDDNINCSKTETIGKSSSSHMFSNLPLAERFSLTIYANENTSGDANPAKTYSFNTIDYEKFFVQNVNEFRLEKTKLQLRWSLENFFWKILRHFEIFFDGNLLTTEKSYITLDIDACKRNYTIVIRCVSKDGTKGADVSYHTNLNDDDIPLSSLDKNINYQQANDSIIISWSPKKEEETCIAHYEIDFNDQNFKTVEARTEINDFAPCITYEVDITPISHHGKRGITSTFEFTTKEFLPQKPTNLKLVEAGNKELTISTTISEDDKQCKSTTIDFKCDNVTVAVNVEVLKAEYMGRLTELRPFTNYNCMARVTNIIGASEWTEVEVFPTKQDGPQAPFNINTSVNDDNTVFVEWTADDSTGWTKSFKVHLKFEDTIYEVADECESEVRNDQIYETTNNQIELVKLEAFSKYSVRVVAENDYGVSDFSKKHVFNTKPSNSSAPRNIMITSFRLNPVDEFGVTGDLRWKAPCKLNGLFSLYTIALKGSRLGFPDHSLTEASSFPNLTISYLKRGFEYDVKVQAVSSGFTGDFEKFTFVAPSGIPLQRDLENWTTLRGSNKFEYGKFDILIRRGIFLSEIGDITGIAFLVFLVHCPDFPQRMSGFISAHNMTLTPTYQAAKDGLECGQLYQQTEILPNPLNGVYDMMLNDYNIKFTIGAESCSNIAFDKKFCNAPLPPNLQYGLIARVFTKRGFRDTEPAYIEIVLNPLKQISPETVVYSSVTIALSISLIILLCCIWNSKKKRQKLLKEKQAAEADENLLSFTSYCVIDKNPLRRKNYDE